jgi:hypothetical protein
LDWEELVCLHEAAHTVIAAAVGHRQNGAAIEKTANGCRGIAQHFPATLPEGARDHPTFEDFAKQLPDFRKATAYAQLAVGTVGWLRYLRTLWIRTDSTLAQHWLAVKMLSSELRSTGTVRRDRAQELLDRWMPVKGEQQPPVGYHPRPEHAPNDVILVESVGALCASGVPVRRSLQQTACSRPWSTQSSSRTIPTMPRLELLWRLDAYPWARRAGNQQRGVQPTGAEFVCHGRP